MLIGKHCSISGGIENACIEAAGLGINTIQIFTKNQRQWKEREISELKGNKFKLACRENGIKVAFSHAIYLINLASNDAVRNQSILALAGELIRCDTLGLPFTVLHPGINKKLSENESIRRISEALSIVFQYTPGLKAKVLLENTAGQGTSIGRRFDQIQQIMSQVETNRLGMAFDTCHAFAAGYDIRSRSGLEDCLAEIGKTVGLPHLKVFHMNDSKGMLGSRIDRHEHIGMGNIGLVPFDYIINHFPDVPKVLETKSENGMDIENIKVLKGLIVK